MEADLLVSIDKTVADALAVPGKVQDKLQAVCDILLQQVPHYDWVGFYIAVPEHRTLKLGPYAGAATEHTDIPYGRGICGQVALTRETFIVPDVTAQDNYLSCSPAVRSEIVVPVMLDGRFVAQLDIDSHKLDPFSPEDESLLRSIAARVAPLFGRENRVAKQPVCK